MPSKAAEIISYMHTLTQQLSKDAIVYLPYLERNLIDLLIFLFPQQIVKQILLTTSLQTVVMCLTITNAFGSKLLMLLSSKKRLERNIVERLNNCSTTYEDWNKLAEEYDRARGYDVWRSNEATLLCDFYILKRRIRDLLCMMQEKDLFNLMFRLRGGLARDQYGIQNEGLFCNATAGTLNIVETYHEVVIQALNTVCDSVNNEIPTDAKLAFFNETRHAYGRTALLLSGGAYLGYYHMGVVRALWTQGLLPRVISGASAGSLMCTMIGVKTDEELQSIFAESGPLLFDSEFFRLSTKLQSPMANRIQKLIPSSYHWLSARLLAFIFDGKLFNLDTEHFKRVVLSNTGSYTFQEAFDRTGRIINITVAPINNYDPPKLLNYLTAPHVCVWSAAVASCALPGVFESMPLIVKEPTGLFRLEHEWTRSTIFDAEAAKLNHFYTDGSLENDLPMQQLSELFNVNHFIISQVNPHLAILSSLSLRSSAMTHVPVFGWLVGYVRFLKATLRDWLKNIVNLFNYHSGSPVWSTKRGAFQTLTQDYEGRENDVTIMPWVGHINPVIAFLSILKNPSVQEYYTVVKAGEVATWPYIVRIKSHCAVEMCLDKCVQQLRKQISSENSSKASIDRTPSFYTSRSIINLSGLSVSDPVPKRDLYLGTNTLRNKKITKRGSNTISNTNPNTNIHSTVNRSSDGNSGRNDYEVVGKDCGSSSCNGISSSSGSGSHDNDDDYYDSLGLTLSVRAPDAVLIDGVDDDLINDYEDDDIPNDSAAIHKTTNMASFYYKKDSKSEEDLVEYLHKNFA